MITKGFVMSEFNNVTVVKFENLYFDGLVSSRTLRVADGSEKNIESYPGTCAFNTVEKELMEIQQGCLEVQLPGSNL